ncbi:MAG: SRPBCC domain-containing protein [Candidatus Zixiibacteriota bacterium]
MKRTDKLKRVTMLLLVVILQIGPAVIAADEGEKVAEQKEHFFIQLLGTRENWPDNMTPAEESTMTAHYFYLKDLVAQGTVLMAGPVFDPVFGLIVVEAASKADARAIIEKDPSVIAGLHTFEIHPMRVSLLVDNVAQDRYVANPSSRRLVKEVLVDAGIAEVYRAWTSTEGVETFFAPDAHVELKPNGPYEIYFSPDSPDGQRGSEGCRVLGYLPSTMLSFEWNAPPQFPELRKIHTQVVVMLDELETGETRVTLTHHGWGEGGQWNEVYDYFDKAWEYVLNNLHQRFTTGPIEWE